MKRTLTVAAALLLAVLAFAQPAKKPSLMVVPSRVWCNQNGFMMNYEGGTAPVPDYRAAFDQSQELNMVVSKIGQMMSDRGFDLKMMSNALQTIQNNAAEDMLLTSKSGADIVESPIDKLRKTAKADIWMEVNWVMSQGGFSYTLTFDLSGIDAYTDKQIANCQGTSEPAYTADAVELLTTSAAKYLDNFNEQLMAKFDDWFDNGREIALTIKTWGDWEYDLEEEFDGEELGVLIENWVGENTVNGQFSTDDATESMMMFSNVRIPMITAEGKAIDARAWGRGLQKMLKAKYAIDAKVMTKGLGSVTVVLGGK